MTHLRWRPSCERCGNPTPNPQVDETTRQICCADCHRGLSRQRSLAGLDRLRPTDRDADAPVGRRNARSRRGWPCCAAREEGVVPGGGVALIRSGLALASLEAPGDQRLGVKSLQRALEAPLRQIAENAGHSGTVVLDHVRAQTGAVGFDARSATYVDLSQAGILDPTKVVRCALAHAASIAGLMLTTEVLVTEPRENPSETSVADMEEYGPLLAPGR